MSEKHYDYALSKKGELIRVDGLVWVYGGNRRVKEIKKIGQTFQLTLDDWTYALIDAVVPLHEPPPIPQRFVRFETNLAPVYIDLEQVVALGNSNGQNVTFMLRSGQSLTMHHSFKDDIVKIMDAWIEYQNDRWQREQHKR